MNDGRQPASFRDPNGFIFSRDQQLYRQINLGYQKEYDHLMQSGLYAELVEVGLLVSHAEASITPEAPDLAYKVIQPERIDFISYPYEWSFSQLKAAALATLEIQKRALAHGMALKDASAYNIQFRRGKPVLIDTLSFEFYPEGKPWVAYRQFCQHFIAPLSLMAKKDIRLNQLTRVYIDGIPLDLASRLLPASTRLNAGLLMHVHLHAGAQKRYADKPASQASLSRPVSRMAFTGLMDSLEALVRGLQWKPVGTEWADYYPEMHHYGAEAFEQKKQIVQRFIQTIHPGSLLDLGANTGMFSRLASDQGVMTVAVDVDPAAVEQNYRTMVEHKEEHLLPLVLDLTNPSPAIGWSHQERDAFMARGQVDAVMALALIHHLAISNNLPFDQIARFFSALAPWLIVEFVPKEDSQVQLLLATRQDIFCDYHPQGFEKGFSPYYEICDTQPLKGSPRCLYLMKRLGHA